MIGIAGGGMLIVAIAIGVAIRPGADSSRNGPRDFEATTTCEATCAALARCELSGANCMDLCQENAMFKGCMQTPDCDVFSTCILGAACPGNAPRGTGTCEAAALCEAGCRRDDRACECTCVGNLAPEHAVALTRLNLCSAVFCQQAANVPACAEQLCARPLRACLSGRLDP